MTRIRIALDGTVRGLWTDEIDWSALGKAVVERASHVEFCGRRQQWHVREGRARHALWAILEFVLRRPLGDVLHWSGSRKNALAWEHDHFSPGGPGWQQKKENRIMELLRFLFALLSVGGRQQVSDHHRSQAFGPRWTRRRRRHIAGYGRRRPHRKGARH